MQLHQITIKGSEIGEIRAARATLLDNGPERDDEVAVFKVGKIIFRLSLRCLSSLRMQAVWVRCVITMDSASVQQYDDDDYHQVVDKGTESQHNSAGHEGLPDHLQHWLRSI